MHPLVTQVQGDTAQKYFRNGDLDRGTALFDPMRSNRKPGPVGKSL